MDDDQGKTVNARTWLEDDESGWFCAVGFWVGEDPNTEPYESIRVGPFQSYREAHAVRLEIDNLMGVLHDLTRRGSQSGVGVN